MIRFYSHFIRTAIAILAVVTFCGCEPEPQGKVDEQKDPFYLKGRNLVTAKDFKGAVEQFERALEVNPRSAAAHFELGWLYEEHIKDYAAAIYHYQRHLMLRPNSEYVERAREHIKACKMDLAKTEVTGPVTQSMQRDLDRLNMENVSLRKQIEQLQNELASRSLFSNPVSQVIQPANTTPLAIASNRTIQPRNQTPPTPDSARRGGPRPRVETKTPPPATKFRLHTVKPGETLGSISRQYGLKVGVLISANPQVDPKKMKAGQIIRIPGSN